MTDTSELLRRIQGATDEPLFDAVGFARRVRVRLAERKMNVRDAAAEIGCSKATISRICREYCPDVENYLRIERWLAQSTPAQADNPHMDGMR